MNEANELIKKIDELKLIKETLKQEIIELDNEILYQDFGMYQPQYNFVNIEQYKDKLKLIKNKQKELIRIGEAAKCNTEWKVQGSDKNGKKMIGESIKQILRNFNIECDLIINKVKFYNYSNSKARIFKAFEQQNKLHETLGTYITDNYYKLKISELNLAYEYQQKKKQDKEEARIRREQLKEEAIVAHEIKEKRKELSKEQEHYQNYLKKIIQQLDIEQSEERKKYLLNKKEELDKNINDVMLALNDLDYREANHRAGYVYIISNIGSFGENVYKIGMTRRLEPEERIAELSGASVPFKFDIHAMIFSDDAPKLEATLHKEFEDKKINLVNGRKEFFKVSLDEIKKIVNKNHDKTVEFVNIPEAEQYRESIMLRKKIPNE